MNQKQKINMLLLVLLANSYTSLHAQPADNSAKQIYAQNCRVCHADDGSGAMPGVSDLVASQIWAQQSDAQLLERLKRGIQTPGAAMAMPPKGGNLELTDKQLQLVIKYMRKEFLK